MSLKNSDELILQIWGYLCKITKKGNDQFDGMRLAQTAVLINGHISNWYLNGKNGEYLVKKKENLNFY